MGPGQETTRKIPVQSQIPNRIWIMQTQVRSVFLCAILMLCTVAREGSAFAAPAFTITTVTPDVNIRVRRVDAKTGIITTFAGNGLPHRIDVLM